LHRFSQIDDDVNAVDDGNPKVYAFKFQKIYKRNDEDEEEDKEEEEIIGESEAKRNIRKNLQRRSWKVL
jgi:tRNA threonylcarbamoyladenosine modification (KEOPS) complex Cgi121 subunit